MAADFTGTRFTELAPDRAPGIYDSVSIEFADNPRIESVQVAPRIATSEIVVQTKLINRGPAGEFLLRHSVTPAKGTQIVARGKPVRVKLATGETLTLSETIRIPGASLWSPEHPNLYRLETRTDGDSARTRFGMREFRSDSKTKRFYLNGQVRYLRGTNITLHRFFEDPDRGALPWDEAWVRRLLVDIPRSMHWDSMRFCIGPVPDKWLEIADEAGLLIQNEFFVWTGEPSWDPGYSRTYDVPETIRQYSEWVRDNWNHPSIVIWDANNESLEPLFGEKIIPAVRGLDLSHRPWENSFNPPAAPDDPREDHPYLFIQDYLGTGELFDMASLETMDGSGVANGTKSDHTRLINEYGWLWLNRDGTPTPLTEKLYARLLGPGATSEQRLSLNAYLLAAETEFWRAHRQYAGVLHFVYLTGAGPGSYTADHFKNVKTLELEPRFADYVGEAFKPLGVYLKFHQPTLRVGETRAFKIMLVNDRDIAATGILELILQSDTGEKLEHVQAPFAVKPLGDAALELSLTVPRASGQHLLVAIARPGGSGWPEPTVSRRRVIIEPHEDLFPVQDRVPQQPLIAAIEIAMQRVEVERDDAPAPDRHVQNCRTSDQVRFAPHLAADEERRVDAFVAPFASRRRSDRAVRRDTSCNTPCAASGGALRRADSSGGRRTCARDSRTRSDDRVARTKRVRANRVCA